MADFVATAFVSIRAELEKGFRANLRSSILRSIGSNPISVPIKAQIQPFRAQLQAEARKSPILIPVKPDVKIGKFREELQAKVAAAAKGVTVAVPVTVGRTVGAATGAAAAGAAAGTGGTGKTKQSAEEKLLTDLANRRAAAQQRLNLSLSQALGPESQLKQVKAGMREIDRALEASIKGQTSGTLSLDAALKKELGTREAALLTLQQDLATRERLLGVQLSGAAVQLEAEAAIGRANSLLSTNVKQIASRATLAELNNDLLAVEADLHELNARAERVEATATKGLIDDKLAEIAVRKENIASQRQELAGSASGARRRSQGFRGAGSSALTFAGIRGATLAAGGPFLAGAAAVAVTAKAIGGAAELEKQLKILGVVSRATAEEMQNVRKASIELGRDVRLPGVSAGDAAKSITALVRAGLSVEDAIDGAKGTLQLATAAEIDFADASQLVASALNAFSLAGTDAVHVADLLTNAANESQAEITDVAISLQQSAGAASLVGVSLDDTIALLTLLSRAGLKGSDAGTSLRTAFIRLVNPTKKANDILERLNINLRDSQGNIRPEVFAEFERATARLTRAEQQRAAAIVFGADAFRTQSLVGRQGLSGLRDVQTALERQGAAAELAGAAASGLSGKLSALSSNLETLGTNLGTIVLPPLKLVVDQLNDFVSDVNSIVDAGTKIAGSFKDMGENAKESVPFLDKVVDRLKKVAKFVPRPSVSPIPAPLKAGIGIGRALTQDEEDVKKRTLRIRALILELFATLSEGPLNLVALNETVLKLQDFAAQLDEGDANAKKLAGSVREIIKQLQDTGINPGFARIEVQLDPEQARKEGDKGAQAVEDAIRFHLPGFVGLGEEIIGALGVGIDKGAPDLGLKIAGKISLETRKLLAEAAGDVSGQLSAIDQQLASARRQQARQRQLFESGQRPDLEDELQATTQRIIELQNARKSIIDDRKQAAKQAADDAKEAQEEEDQAFLDRLGGNRQRAQNRIAIAAQTAELDDDIKATIFLKKLIRLQIERIKDQVKTVKLKKDALKELTQQLFEIDQEIQKLNKERKDALRESIRTGIELDIEFFQITENEAGETRARRRLIASLQKELNALAAIKKKTIEQKNRMKEIRNEIAEQRKAIQEITQENRKLFAELSFNFLTTQQGFAANLLGNLLPLGAIGGTVGGSAGGPFTTGGGRTGASPADIASNIGLRGRFPEGQPRTGLPGGPSAAIAEASRVSTAEARGGFTSSQAATLIALTERVLAVLQHIDTGAKNPEGKQARRANNARFDVHK